MYSVLKENFLRYEDAEGIRLNEIRAELFCDTADDLPDANAIKGRLLAMGSIAYVIEAGTMYVMNSDGEWISSGGKEPDSTKLNTVLTGPTNKNLQANEPEDPEEMIDDELMGSTESE